MIRKVNGKKQPSGNGGPAVVDNSAPVGRGRAGNTSDVEIERVSQEILRLVDASRHGRLDERGKVEQFQGTHREMLQGINEMLDAILLPIGEGNRILAQISEGKVDELIAHTYKGDHEKMKLAVNNVGTVVQGLQKEL
jgi:methyl-accepting chemotaxis protein